MKRSKKIFIALAVVFFVLLMYASYDISRRTTFPGSKSQLKERIKKKLAEPPADTVDTKKPLPVDSSADMSIQPVK